MTERTMLVIKDNIINFKNFKMLNNLCTLTFAGNRITLQPIQSINTEDKFCFLLNEKKEYKNIYVADYIREVCNITSKEFLLDFEFLEGIHSKGLYFHTIN